LFKCIPRDHYQLSVDIKRSDNLIIQNRFSLPGLDPLSFIRTGRSPGLQGPPG
jgi:hypothetical protein